MFRVFGHDKVWVLDGGLPQWRASGYDVESSASSDAILKASAAGEAIEKVYQGQSVIYSIIFYFLFLLAILPLQVATALQEPYYCY
jgi:3-mercaptopyruvate sulfurtransferase SseA